MPQDLITLGQYNAFERHNENVRRWEEQKKNDSQKATSLRKLMSLYQPDRKDEFNTMDLGNLEGEAAAHADGERLSRERDRSRSAAALAALMSDAGRVQTEPFQIPQREIGGVTMAPRTMPAMEGRGPATLDRLQKWLPAHPEAVNADHFAPTVNALRGLLGEQSGFGPEAQGVARPISGVPGRFFVPTSQGGGQVLDTNENQTPEYTADSFKFDDGGNPTHWKVGDAWVKWNPKMTLAPGARAGTVRVIPPQAPNPLAALFGGGGGDAETPNPKTQTPNPSSEVTRYVGGKAAIFDAKTKKFLRYAD